MSRSPERLEIHVRCLRGTKNDQLWEAHAEHRGRVGPTVESYSRKSARTKARTAFRGVEE
jgi:hypothetical protein